jgi:hypothetical protein
MHADRLLEDGDTIDVADLHFKVINTPGHTYGGICLYGQGAVLREPFFTTASAPRDRDSSRPSCLIR